MHRVVIDSEVEVDTGKATPDYDHGKSIDGSRPKDPVWRTA
jgi:hypothetical protein